MTRRSLCALIFCTALLLVSRVAWSGAPPTEPLLRIETGMHTAMIKGIAADAAGRWLVSASDDKTVRVWDLAGSGGELAPARILRPPIATGNEGKLFAVAISPDGGTVVCGGWTGWEWDRNASLYFFDRESGRLVKRLDGFPDVIKALAYSRDGKKLAVALGAGKGVYLLQVADWKLAGIDRDYGNDCYALGFDQAGRLATASWDGLIRLYGPNLNLIAKRKAPNGGRPYSLAFSGDGGKIAIGCDDGRKVAVLSGSDLAPLYTPPGGADDGSLFSVAWSPDGSALYAAGSFRDGSRYLVRRWDEGGRGRFTDLPVSGGNVMHLLPLGNGRLAYASPGPELGIVDAAGSSLFHRGAGAADFREVPLLVSSDGSAVGFGYAPGAKGEVVFTVADRSVTGKGARPDLLPPLAAARGIDIRGWRNGDHPTVNGKPLRLEEHEVSRSLSIAPDGSGFLLGTDWYLRLYDKSGAERWRVAAPGIAWGVNASVDGRFAVAAFGDGTIRWYRLDDGRPLLSYFPHADRRRWILWTPSGYYDASIGGEELAGWQLNDGPEQAGLFFPISRFRAVYCRPDLVSRILLAGDEGEAIKQVNSAAGRSREERSVATILPPLVSISSPSDRSVVQGSEQAVSFVVRSPSGAPATGVRVLLNGRPVPFREKDGSGESRSILLTVPEGESAISVIAENRHAVSEPATVTVFRPEAEPVPRVISMQPRLLVLAVGVGAYPGKEMALEFAAKDAEDFVSLMRRQEGGLYGEVSAKVLTDAAATRAAILEGLDWLQHEATGRDTAVVFLSGHGITEAGGTYYFLPVNGDPARLQASSVVFTTIRKTLMTLPGKALLFVDTCHAGDVMGGRAAGVNAAVNELSSAENGVVVFASSTGEQYSLEDDAWGNGAFTKALVEGVKGKADYTGKGRITVTSLDLWLSERVQELTGGRQTPTTAKPRTIPDFPLALKR